MHGTIRRLRIGLGTLIAIEAASDSPDNPEHAIAAVESAFAAIAAVDERMRPLSCGSDLAKINHAPLNTAVGVHPDVCELLQLAQRLHALTGGVFDPCLPHLPGRLSDVHVSSDCRVLCQRPVALDFGGFAKGYAVDRAIEVLQSHGCVSGLVNAGGDLRVFGSRTEEILLRNPDGQLTPVPLQNAALAVSDVDSQQRPLEHQGYYNRAASAPVPVTRFAGVLAPTAVMADALVKCVLLCPQEVTTRALTEFAAQRINSG